MDDDGSCRAAWWFIWSTLNINRNTDKLYATTKSPIQKYFNYLNVPHESIEQLPDNYDSKEFLDKFCSFRLTKCRVTKINGLMPSLLVNKLG